MRLDLFARDFIRKFGKKKKLPAENCDNTATITEFSSDREPWRLLSSTALLALQRSHKQPDPRQNMSFQMDTWICVLSCFYRYCPQKYHGMDLCRFRYRYIDVDIDIDIDVYVYMCVCMYIYIR